MVKPLIIDSDWLLEHGAVIDYPRQVLLGKDNRGELRCQLQPLFQDTVHTLTQMVEHTLESNENHIETEEALREKVAATNLTTPQ